MFMHGALQFVNFNFVYRREYHFLHATGFICEKKTLYHDYSE